MNVGTLVGRSVEVMETVGKRRVDVMALQEVCFRNKGIKTLRGSYCEYRLYWKGKVTASRGVGFMVKCELTKSVMEESDQEFICGSGVLWQSGDYHFYVYEWLK